MSMKPVLALIAVEVAQDPEDHGVAEADEAEVDEVEADAVAAAADAVAAEEGDAFSKRHPGI
jgi:hypothetical protein